MDLSPYYHFTVNDMGLKSAIYGSGIFNEEKRLNQIADIRFNRNFVYIDLYNRQNIQVKDIRFSLEHYKSYFKRSQNWKYYFFSQIKSIKSTSNGVRFELKKRGLFKKEYFSFPILKKDEAEERIERKVFRNPLRYRGYGAFTLFSQNKSSYSLRRLEPEKGKINLLRLREYSDFNSLLNALVQKKIDFYQFHYIDAIANSLRQVFSNYRRRAYQLDENHLIYLVFNQKKFDLKERRELRKLVNRSKIRDQFLRLKGQSAKSIFRKQSPYFYSKGMVEFKPLEAIQNLLKNDYHYTEKGYFAKKKRKYNVRIFYPKSNYLLQKIANEIVLNFADAQILLEPIPLSYEEISFRLPRNKYDLILTDAFYRDFEYISLLRKFESEKLFSTERVVKHIKRLELIDSESNYIPILQQVQRQIKNEAVLFPLFFADHYQILISRNVSNFLKRVQFNERFFYGLEHFSEWKFNVP